MRPLERSPPNATIRPSGLAARAALRLAALLMTACLAKAEAASPVMASDRSFANELQRAIDKGLACLGTSQNSNGWWSTPDHPAVSSLVLMAYQGEPTGRFRLKEPEAVKKGYAYVFSCVQPDGGIHCGQLITYNTSISLMALVAANKPEYEPAMRKARQLLVGLQRDFGEPGKIDSPFDGGVGYGTQYEHSDMGNTLQALEALYYSRHLVRDANLADSKDLNWEAAINFLQSCQNLTSHNQELWASDDPQNKGGFIYYPGHSMAGTVTNAATGKVALRSYASISYGGMLSYIYANLKRDDPRVKAVFEWLRSNYDLKENPGMGQQGLFFYYHTMAKALTAYGVNELELTNGTKVNWRKELGLQLLNLQQQDGSWFNENNRWWEKDPALVTAYAVLTLEIIARGI